ncbi:1756_t:CDS:1, partial [Cetraspora pellucida]
YPSFSQFTTKNNELKEAIINLEQKIRNNIMLGHLKRAINAFKQWVFPFAHVYLDVLSLEVDDNSDIDSIIQLIGDLKSKTQEHYTFINKYDKFLINEKFCSDCKTTKRVT